MTDSVGELIQDVDTKISAVRTQSVDFSFNELADMYEDGELIIDPDFQRMFRWTEGAQSRFIESLLLELPLPPIFLIEREDRIYELIDGLQRISSYLHFRGQLRIDGELREALVLGECDIVDELNGLTYAALPKALEIKAKRSYIRAEILRKESDPRLRYYMFKRLNTGGERLSEQEVRNATIRLLSNEFNQWLADRSAHPSFRSIVLPTVSERAVERRFDQELVLRFFAFKNELAGYRHEIGEFLTDYLEAASDPTVDTHFDYAAELEVFNRTFDLLSEVDDRLGYDGKIFGSVVSSSESPRGQFSVYHFEGITLGLARWSSRFELHDEDQVNAIAEVIRVGKFDDDFLRHTGAGKNDPNPLKARIDYFEDAFTRVFG